MVVLYSPGKNTAKYCLDVNVYSALLCLSKLVMYGQWSLCFVWCRQVSKLVITSWVIVTNKANTLIGRCSWNESDSKVMSAIAPPLLEDKNGFPMGLHRRNLDQFARTGLTMKNRTRMKSWCFYVTIGQKVFRGSKPWKSVPPRCLPLVMEDNNQNLSSILVLTMKSGKFWSVCDPFVETAPNPGWSEENHRNNKSTSNLCGTSCSKRGGVFFKNFGLKRPSPCCKVEATATASKIQYVIVWWWTLTSFLQKPVPFGLFLVKWEWISMDTWALRSVSVLPQGTGRGVCRGKVGLWPIFHICVEMT